MNYLAAGYLASEGLVKSKSEIKKILVDERRELPELKPLKNWH